MAPSSITIPVPELTGLLREAIRSALTEAHDGFPDEIYGNDAVAAMANHVAKSLVVNRTGRADLPALTSGQLLTITCALDAACASTRSIILRAGEDVATWEALLEEQDSLYELFDQLLGDQKPTPFVITTTGTPQAEGTIELLREPGREHLAVVEVKAGDTQSSLAARVAEAANAQTGRSSGLEVREITTAAAVDYCTECGCDEAEHRDSVTHRFTSTLGRARSGGAT